jgi:hypothetical protein
LRKERFFGTSKLIFLPNFGEIPSNFVAVIVRNKNSVGLTKKKTHLRQKIQISRNISINNKELIWKIDLTLIFFLSLFPFF